VRLDEKFHNHMPDYADCRPIFARQSIEQSGYPIEAASTFSTWGLPVEIIPARKLPLDGSIAKA
jgi:hypothetical protein